MAFSKRKNVVDDAGSKERAKRQKSDVGTKSRRIVTLQQKDNGDSKSTPPKSATTPTSILTKEQPLFPRGGAGLLTPLERKQIHAKAIRDTAAELEGGHELFGSKKTFENSDDDSDLDEAMSQDSDAVTTQPKNKKSLKVKRKEKVDAAKRSTVAVEGLSYKRLTVGSQILGRIASINLLDLAIALPNNLTGYVAGSAVSAIFTEKITKALRDSEREVSPDGEDGDEDEENLGKDVSLESHFHVGQWLRVTVTSLGNESAGQQQSKRRIELSLDPRESNRGISKSALIPGTALQAAVASVEDHGLVVDLGLDGEDAIRGFIPAKALTPMIPLSSIKTGAVLLCHVTAPVSSGKTLQLSPQLMQSPLVKSTATVEALLPGTLVEVLLTEVGSEGLVGKVMGMVDVTADIVHSGSFRDREIFAGQFKIGQKVKGRLLFTLPLSESKKLGFSILPDLVSPSLAQLSEQQESGLQTSAIIPTASVVRVASGLGIYLSLPSGQVGFAHVSRLSDKKVDSVSETIGPYKLNTEHRCRLLDYNLVDGLYILSLQKSILEQPFLRIEDVPVGECVKGTIEKVIVGANGVSGLLVRLAEGVTGLVPAIHMSDITLQHPEKKFREGGVVSVRVLSVNKLKRQLRLTLKKTLVNSDQRIWTKFEDVSIGDATIGTLVKVDSHGALVQFFGDVKGYLPVSEMSEAYIKDAREHFKTGQVLTVNAINVNIEEQRLTISCRESSTSAETVLASIVPGTLVNGVVFEKSQDDLLLRLAGSEAIARLALDQVSDGSERKRRSALDKIRVGQGLENLLVWEVQRKGRLVILSNRQALVKAAQAGEILADFENLKQDALFTGLVSNITENGVFLRFANGISGLIPIRQLPETAQALPEYGMQSLQPVTAKVMSIDYKGATPRFWLTMREHTAGLVDSKPKQSLKDVVIPDIVDPVDASISSFKEFVTGKVTKARITSVKETQINVELAKDIQGRIDMSEIFNEWNDIKDRKQPLRMFGPKQVLDVRILGAHDTRNHRFLPLTHRTSKNTVFELSAKPTTIHAEEVPSLSLHNMEVGSSWLAYVNNFMEDFLMVNISPSVRGRIKAIDVSDDLSLAGDLSGNFPIGSAIRVKVLAIDQDKGRLDLTGRSNTSSKSLSLESMSAGMILPGRVTRVAHRSILVQLSDNVVGAVDLVDMADDYNLADPARFQKNDVVRVSVLRIDIPNKKVVLSLRPSKVLSTSLNAVDPEITTVQQVNVNDVVRGFISNITDKGVFITLGHGVTGFVRVTNLSDLYLKAWKDNFQRDQLVKAKVIAVDKDSNHIQLSLKESLMNADYKPPKTFASMSVGDIVTGKVAKVETFGVFIVVDHSENVRGLCHRSEIAEKTVGDASKLFTEGDKVKAKVLKIDLPKRRINFGMKAAYFADSDDEMGDAEIDMSEDEMDANGGAGLENDDNGDDIVIDMFEEDDDQAESSDDDDDDESGIEETKEDEAVPNATSGLSVGGFDWYGMPEAASSSLKRGADDSIPSEADNKQKKRKKAGIEMDRTGDLDVNGPQSTDDFERLLLGEPDSSILWLQYMAFHLELGDVDQARQIGERALKTMGLGQDVEKLNVWIALLNLENAYGDDESIDSMFKRACEYNDPQEIYSRLISIYIQSGKHSKADDLFQEMLKKFTQDPKLYINYANFLFDTLSEADRGRALLSRALQVLPAFTNFDLTSKFAQLEFKSPAGLAERGRTIFEGLINSFPKRIDLFNIMLDMEMKHGSHNATDGSDHARNHNDANEGRNEQVRALFERIFSGSRQLKPKQAKYFFKRWLAFEEENGDDPRKIEEVKAKAATWVKKSSQS